MNRYERDDLSRWSSGLRLHPLTVATGVRLPYGIPEKKRRRYGFCGVFFFACFRFSGEVERQWRAAAHLLKERNCNIKNINTVLSLFFDKMYKKNTQNRNNIPKHAFLKTTKCSQDIELISFNTPYVVSNEKTETDEKGKSSAGI